MGWFGNKQKNKYDWELKLIGREISRSKRFGYNFGVLAVKLSHSVPRGLSKVMPGKTISFHILKENIRFYDRVINFAFRRYYIILPQTDKNGVKEVKERIYNLAQGHNWGDLTIGSAFYPEDGEEPQLLLDKANGKQH
jgi:hypothetical protein